MPDHAHAKADDSDVARRKDTAAEAAAIAPVVPELAVDGRMQRTWLAAPPDEGGDDGRGNAPSPRSVRERKAFAHGLSRVHGNRHLSRVIGGMVRRQVPPAAPGAPPVGVIPSGEALQARAQEVLTNTYGSIKKIVPSRVEVVDEPTLRVKFDEMQIRKGTTNPKTQQKWEMGGSLQVFQRLDGFADRDNAVIYVPNTPGSGAATDSTLSTVVHEMLHTNVAGDWAGTVGGAIDEGETELLAMKACTGQRVPISPQYAGQRDTTQKLVPVAGADTLERAYFGGVSILAAAVEAVLGEGKWAKLVAVIKEGDAEKFNDLLRARHASDWAKEKIRTILAIIDEFWVSDEDVARIVAICATASPDDLKAISAAVSPELSRLNDHGQRAKIRIALGH